MMRIEEITPETLREALGLPGRSQAGLARHLGLDASAVNRMLNGKRQIKARELTSIRDYLEITKRPPVPPTEEQVQSIMNIEDPVSRRLIASTNRAFHVTVRELVIESWVIVFSSLRDALESRVKIPNERDPEKFWATAQEAGKPLVYMALGAGLINERLSLKILVLSELAAEAVKRRNSDFESDPAVEAMLRTYLGLREEEAWPSPASIRARLAVLSSTISLALEGNADGIGAAVDTLEAVLQPIIDHMRTGDA